MDQNKEKEHGNISTLGLLFREWSAGLFWEGMRLRGLREDGGGARRVEGVGQSHRGCLCTDQDSGDGWQTTIACDALASQEQTGSCCRVLPLPATLQETEWCLLKRERGWRGEQNTTVQTWRHATSLLDSSLLFTAWHPLPVFWDIISCRASLRFSGCFLKQQRSPQSQPSCDCTWEYMSAPLLPPFIQSYVWKIPLPWRKWLRHFKGYFKRNSKHFQRFQIEKKILFSNIARNNDMDGFFFDISMENIVYHRYTVATISLHRIVIF